MPHSQRIAEFLLSIGAVTLSPDDPYTWTSGIKSPVYCDNRMIYGHPDARDFVVKALSDRVRNLHIEADAVAGTAMAAIGWGALVAHALRLPFCYVRPKAKEHGKKNRIEGDLKPGSHVVLIEDLLSTGGSSLSSVEALREEGKCVVSDIVSIFSYEFETAREAAATASIHLHPLCTVSTLAQVAVDQNRISEAQRDLVLRFVKEPERWGK